MEGITIYSDDNEGMMDYNGEGVGIHGKPTTSLIIMVENRLDAIIRNRLRHTIDRVQVWFGFSCPDSQHHGQTACHHGVPAILHA